MVIIIYTLLGFSIIVSYDSSTNQVSSSPNPIDYTEINYWADKKIKGARSSTIKTTEEIEKC